MISRDKSVSGGFIVFWQESNDTVAILINKLIVILCTVYCEHSIEYFKTEHAGFRVSFIPLVMDSAQRIPAVLKDFINRTDFYVIHTVYSKYLLCSVSAHFRI